MALDQTCYGSSTLQLISASFLYFQQLFVLLVLNNDVHVIQSSKLEAGMEIYSRYFLIKKKKQAKPTFLIYITHINYLVRSRTLIVSKP